MGDKTFNAMRELLSASIAYEESRMAAMEAKRRKGSMLRYKEFMDARVRWLSAQNACLEIVKEHDANG